MLAALTVSGCAGSPADPVVRTVIARPEIPPAARVPCARPASPPDRDLTAQEVFAYWSRTSLALLECEQKRAAAVRAVEGAR